MSAAVVPLDPDSPAGIAAAERFSEVLARLQVNVWARMNAKPKPVSPKPSNPKPARPGV
ncbi:MAG: hypothetical protein HOV94_34520 [Saccharothrix sp.]|nr:hypothetical protein [Saccharothrix sp.]